MCEERSGRRRRWRRLHQSVVLILYMWKNVLVEEEGAEGEQILRGSEAGVLLAKVEANIVSGMTSRRDDYEGQKHTGGGGG